MSQLCRMRPADIAIVCAWLLMLVAADAVCTAYRVADDGGIGIISPATLYFRVHGSLHGEVPGIDHYGVTLCFRVHGSRVADDDGIAAVALYVTDDIGLRHAGIWRFAVTRVFFSLAVIIA